MAVPLPSAPGRGGEVGLSPCRARFPGRTRPRPARDVSARARSTRGGRAARSAVWSAAALVGARRPRHTPSEPVQSGPTRVLGDGRLAPRVFRVAGRRRRVAPTGTSSAELLAALGRSAPSALRYPSPCRRVLWAFHVVGGRRGGLVRVAGRRRHLHQLKLSQGRCGFRKRSPWCDSSRRRRSGCHWRRGTCGTRSDEGVHVVLVLDIVV